jgi:uncharacterized HAD superfamily protein
MERKIIGVDLDDVVFDCHTALAQWHNRNYGTNYSRSDVASFDLTRTWGVSEVEKDRRIGEFIESEDHHNAQPVAGSFEGLSLLCDIYDLHVITARGEHGRSSVLPWVEKHAPNIFKDLHFTGRSHQNPNGFRSKRAACEALGARHLIEDAPHNVIDVADVVTSVLLFDTPWNQGIVVPQNVTRVYSWKDITQKLVR